MIQHMSPTRTATLGAMLIVMGSVSMALYTPAMPLLVDIFKTDPGTIKLTLTIYFFGYAFAQLISGPLSDAWGRRPTTLCFLAFYLAGSVVCALAATVEMLLVGRLLQGIGAAGGVVLSRAIVRDQFIGQTSTRIMNTIGLMVSLGPSFAPTLGGFLLTAFGWHSIFLVMVGYGLILVGLVIFILPETLPHRDLSNLHPGRIIRNYVTLLTDRTFMRPSMVIGLTLGGLYTMAAILPFVLVDTVGLTPTQFGLAMLMQSGAYILGSIVVRQMLKHRTAHFMVPFGLATILTAGAAMAVVFRIIEPSFLSVMVPVGIWAFGIAFIMPAMTTDALANFPTMAGAAAALTGFMQIGGGFLGTLLAALFGDPLTALGTLLPLMAVTAVIIQLTMGGSSHKRGAPTSTIAPAE